MAMKKAGQNLILTEDMVAALYAGADRGRPLARCSLDSMAERVELAITDVRAVGRDWRISCKIAGSGRSGDG